MSPLAFPWLATPPSAAAAALALHGASHFSWTRWEMHASVLVGCALFAGLYLAGIGPLRRRRQLGDPVAPWRPAAFLAGVVVLFVSLNGPIHDLSDHYLFSAHMVQHLLITLVVPPLWLMGTPAWLLRPLLAPAPLAAVARLVTRPLVAFTLYNLIFAGWHLPGFYNAALEHHGLHIVQHLTFIGASVLMWWPVAAPLELNRLSSPLQMLYLFALGVPMSIVAALITLSDRVVYAWYDAAPRVFGLSALEDQQLGGLIMWVPGGLVFWVAISVVFFRWAAREDREEARERARAGGLAIAPP